MNCDFDPGEHNDIALKFLECVKKKLDLTQLSSNGKWIEYKLIQNRIMCNNKFGVPYPETSPYIKVKESIDVISVSPDKMSLNSRIIHVTPDICSILFDYLFKRWCDYTEVKLDVLIEQFSQHIDNVNKN